MDQELLKKIQEEHDKNTKARECAEDMLGKLDKERKLWKKVSIAIAGTALLVFIMIGASIKSMEYKMEKNLEQTGVLMRNAVTYDNFFLFNRTYELQMEEIHAFLNGDNEELKNIQEKYRELRSMIVRQPTFRGER